MTSAARAPFTGRLNSLVIDCHGEEDRAMLAAYGELVHGCADTLARTLDGLPAGVGRIELDMTDVAFMDTAGLAFLDLLDEYADRHGVRITVTGWQGQPRRILELAGIDAGADTAPAGTASAVALERAEQLRCLRLEIEQLRHAIVSRPVIDQARGVLMATHGCTSDQAWDILRETSQLTNTKLRAVAETVTASAVPDGPPPPERLRTALRTAVARHTR
ncbi:ANTAR domain-containing response regulator [Streptomyces sp. NPDC006739]|uniref:ANTAR domain-containing response regulator n=1 Tax=Streptomyces sp. NPDC006739 TaxID=3364763 RepID=UPI0036898DE4